MGEMETLLFQTDRAASLTPIESLVDENRGVISSVSVITIGPALGHGMVVDATTLAQIKACAEQYSNGLKVKLNHNSGAGDIVGTLSAFRISNDGTKLLADFAILDRTPHREYIVEIAKKLPESFGLSVAFSGLPEDINGVRYARCAEIYSCDLVDQPAANRDGLFSRRFDEWQKGKGNAGATAPAPSRTTKQLSKMENELLTQIGSMIDEKLAAVTAKLNERFAALESAGCATNDKIAEVAEMSKLSADKAALAAVKEFSKTLGAPAGNAAAPSVPPSAPIEKKFEELVREHAEYSKSKAKAITETIKANGKAYAEYQFRVQNNKDVILF